MADSLFTGTPAIGDSADGFPINTATRFKVTQAVTCTHHRFYSSTVDAGTITARLYELTSDTTGTLLAEKAYSSYSLGAYNSVAWDTPVSLVTGKVYATQHHSSGGRYVATTGVFSAGDVTSAGGLLVAVQDGSSPAGFTVNNGCFDYNAIALAATGTAGFNFFDDVIVSAVLSATLGVAAETDTAPALSRTKARTMGLAATTDTSVALARAKARAVGLVAEIDTALVLALSKARLLGVAGATDTATSLTRTKTLALATAAETDTARPITAPAQAPRRAVATSTVSARRTTTSTVAGG